MKTPPVKAGLAGFPTGAAIRVDEKKSKKREKRMEQVYPGQSDFVKLHSENLEENKNHLVEEGLEMKRPATQSKRIAVLSDLVINQIAAGEVIENPASVVKELIENAIDAGATRIEIEIQEGGSQLIKVIDNGCGMGRFDAESSLLRHATSKLRELADLDDLTTMGFRGEALAAIASVSQLELSTHDGREGTKIIIHGGKIEKIESCARNQGTTLEVRSLFFNAPARRKFQKSTQANTSAIVKIVEQIALSYPEIIFSLHSQKQQIFLFCETDWQTRVKEVFGDICDQGIWFSQNKIKGFLGGAQKTRAKQLFSINRRLISSRLLSSALREGYGMRIEEKMHPAAVLFLEISPTEFDVNVHPQKREVRFRDENAIFYLVRNAVQKALLPQALPERNQLGSFTPTSPLSFSHPNSFSIPFEQNCFFEASSNRALTVIGSFLLMEKKEGVFLIDLREDAKSVIENYSEVQTLLCPILFSLSREEQERKEFLIESLLRIGIEARALGVDQICLDALPSWLEEKNTLDFLEAVKGDLNKGLSVEETRERFIRAHPKKFSLEEAEELWKRGRFAREIRLDSEELERYLLKRK